MNATLSDESYSCDESGIARFETSVHIQHSSIVLHFFQPLRLARHQKIFVTNPP